MIFILNIKEWLNWPLIRVYVCTLAVSVNFNLTWRVPRDGVSFGGLQYALALTVSLLLVALPLALLQLAVGQLSQQDTVGIWKAVPIFKGVGYLRLLVSFMGSIYAAIYLALVVSYFISIVGNSLSFFDCSDLVFTEDGYVQVFNASECLNSTFMAPLREKPEYYVAMSLIILFTWIALPFLLYNPVKLMKRVFYLFGPLIIILGIVVVSGMARNGRLSWFYQNHQWRNFLYSDIWFRAISQALLTSEVAGGYLISAGDSIYSNNNVQWTTIVFIVTNLVVSWAGLLLWFSIGGGSDMNNGSAAVLVQLYRVSKDDDISSVWPLLAFTALFMSGFITMLIRLYPIYDHIRRVGSVRWRVLCAGCSLVCAGVSLAVLAGRWTSLHILEDVAVPLLASVATVLEVLAFVFIYGWRVLIEDIEFLTGDKMSTLWMVGWCAAPMILTSFCTWWIVDIFLVPWAHWDEPPWTPIVVVTTAGLVLGTLVLFGVVTVARQVQYDVFGKLKSSLKPSRRWGPRDPITHYYWLARRDDIERGNASGSRYRRRELGQLSGAPSFLNVALPTSLGEDVTKSELKRRANSDDWIYTVHRRKYLDAIFSEYLVTSKKYRSKSLDWIKVPKVRDKRDSLDVKL